MTVEDAIEIIESRNFYCIECINRNEECCKALDMAIKALSTEKPAEWQYEKFGFRTCSNCGYSNVGIDDDGVFIPNNYCPSCGAKMIESEEEK